MARPKRQFTDEEVQRIEQYALENSKSETIARALGIAVNTLKRRFGRRMVQLRALGKLELKHNQREIAKTNAQMAQFLGKNELGQQDKQVIRTEIGKMEIPDKQKPAYAEAAKILKLRLAETGT